MGVKHIRVARFCAPQSSTQYVLIACSWDGAHFTVVLIDRRALPRRMLRITAADLEHWLPSCEAGSLIVPVYRWGS